MLRALLNEADTAAEPLITKYALRVAAVFLILIAGGFAAGAAGVFLTARFGLVAALAALAATFFLLGLVAILTGAAVERRNRDLNNTPKMQEEEALVEAAAAGAAQVPAEIGPLLSRLAAAAPLALSAPRLLGETTTAATRNLPLVVFLGLAAFLLLPMEAQGEERGPSVEGDTENIKKKESQNYNGPAAEKGENAQEGPQPAAAGGTEAGGASLGHRGRKAA